MGDVIFLNNLFNFPVETDQVKDELIEAIFNFSPTNVFYWALELAAAQFNQRCFQNNSTWLDKTIVYVGLPNWAIDEQQLKTENLPYLKVSIGWLNDIYNVCGYDFPIAISYQKISENSLRKLRVLHHTTALEFKNEATSSSEIEGFEDLSVLEKRQSVTIKVVDYDSFLERDQLLQLAAETAASLSQGNLWTLQRFYNLRSLNHSSIRGSTEVFSELTVPEFFEWATDHFQLDDVFNDCEHLVDYIKTRLELQPTLLDQCSSYQLLVSIIGRSDRTFENITE